LRSAPRRRLVVAHRDVDGLVAGARPAIAHTSNGLIHDGRLRVVEKWVADTSWGDLAAALAAA
jgi:hypothetical protein